MGDIERIIWGVLGGILVYVIGQLLSKFFIEPLYELRKTIGEIRFNLSFHGATILTPDNRSKENSDAARDALLKNSSDLFTKLHAVPLYLVARIASFGTLPRSKDIERAVVILRGLSTYMYEKGEKACKSLDEIRSRIIQIENLLRFQPLDFDDKN